MSRITRLAARLEHPLLVTKLVNVRWLCGLESSNAALLVEPSGEATLYTDFRYAEAAAAVEGVTFVQTARAVIGALAELLAGREIGVDPEHLTLAAHDALRRGGVGLAADGGHVEALRAVKDAGELDAIRRAAAISDTVFGELADQKLVGLTERELAWQLERRFRELGAEDVAFAPLVGAGEMGARPHGHPRDEPIPAGTMVVVDAGCVVDGYCSDCTRTYLTGDDARLLALYDLCLRGQLDGLGAVRSGAAGSEVDAASRTRIAEAGHAEHYGHGLGHGVGMEIHEGPTLRPESTDVLAVGNVVTVEPGIYLPGDVGVRIEDLVLVTPDGAERLTTVPKDPVVVA
ncbi:MAG: M24 family metallopeptidase [Gaiella sp.]